MKHETNLTLAPQAIVVGAGFGGMAAALRLRARGYNVNFVSRQRLMDRLL